MAGLIDEIKNQKDSTGGKGWPVVVKDRVSFAVGKDAELNDAQVSVTFLWTMRDVIMPKLSKENLAIATNFYTPAGLAGMVRNLLANPQIRYMIMLGNEYACASPNNQGLQQVTSANAIRAFFKQGITGERKIPGFESAVYFDKNIPTGMIQKVSENVQLIDLNSEMPNASLDEKIERANELLKTLEKKKVFLENPVVFAFEEMGESLPFEGGPLLVQGKTIPETWLEMIHAIYTYGRKNLMNANTDRWVKEINNMACVIEDAQNMDLSLNPFLIPLTVEKIRAYQSEILSPELPAGKAYTYGNKLRAYYSPSSKELKELLENDAIQNFEFGKGEFILENVKFNGEKAEINQVKDMIETLKRDPYSKAIVAVTWHPADELLRKHKSSPCLVMIQAMVQDEKLNLTVYFRSHDMVQGWPENAYGMAAIQKEIAEAIKVPCGLLIIISSSAQIYNNYYQQVETALKLYRKPRKDFRDAKGNFLVELKGEEISCTLMHPESSQALRMWGGKTAKELYSRISNDISMQGSHAMYLGTELQKAEIALKKGISFEQDKELKI
ncbi:MAG: thymidylate synthase [Candidatus Diapherotrites archaeon]|nr:thymidylate synthase [Candidatus Diapherotrites archaeon]